MIFPMMDIPAPAKMPGLFLRLKEFALDEAALGGGGGGAGAGDMGGLDTGEGDLVNEPFASARAARFPSDNLARPNHAQDCIWGVA